MQFYPLHTQQYYMFLVLSLARFTLARIFTHQIRIWQHHIGNIHYLWHVFSQPWVLQSNASPFHCILSVPLSLPAFSNSSTMPHWSNHSRTFQQQCQSTHTRAFGTLPTSMPGPKDSDVYVLDDKSDASTIYIDSSNNKECDNEVETVKASVETL